MLLKFLVVQYDAFQKQLELLFSHGSVIEAEYRERAARLERYLDHLHGFLRSVGEGVAREIPGRTGRCEFVGATLRDPTREEGRVHGLRSQLPVAGPLT